MATGWVYYTPLRNIRPQTEVLFWNRLQGVTQDVRVEFGDGTPPQVVTDSIRHAYTKPGIYTVRFTTRGPGQEPVSIKTRVVVEKAQWE